MKNFLKKASVSEATINKIIEETGVKIDIEEDGTVFIYSANSQSGERAKEIVEGYDWEQSIGRNIENEEKGVIIQLVSKE